MSSDYTPHNDITGNFDEDAADAPRADFHETASEAASEAASEGSLMDNLKSIGEAWLAAGWSLGGVASHFVDNLREERGSAAEGEEASANDSVAQQLKAAVDRARSEFSSADNDRDFRSAASSFASDAEGIFRSLAGPLTRAGDATLNSGQTDDAKNAFADAVAEVRETFNQAVAGIRNRAEEADVDAEGAVNDLRSRLEGLISKVTDQLGQSGQDAESEDAADAEVVDGEVVSKDDSN
ncbi:CGLAU_01105 family protein [Corynebacterium sp. LK2510]|uniref:CGLAU_01105 family protein n=1 Tax=Corynebacterium sp. LK2510 TaxID=3110472 RepID=UPI0034CEE1DC